MPPPDPQAGAQPNADREPVTEIADGECEDAGDKYWDFPQGKNDCLTHYPTDPTNWCSWCVARAALAPSGEDERP